MQKENGGTAGGRSWPLTEVVCAAMRKPLKRRSTEKETVLLGESLGALDDLADWVRARAS